MPSASSQKPVAKVGEPGFVVEHIHNVPKFGLGKAKTQPLPVVRSQGPSIDLPRRIPHTDDAQFVGEGGSELHGDVSHAERLPLATNIKGTDAQSKFGRESENVVGGSKNSEVLPTYEHSRHPHRPQRGFGYPSNIPHAARDMFAYEGASSPSSNDLNFVDFSVQHLGDISRSSDCNAYPEHWDMEHDHERFQYNIGELYNWL